MPNKVDKFFDDIEDLIVDVQDLIPDEIEEGAFRIS